MCVLYMYNLTPQLLPEYITMQCLGGWLSLYRTKCQCYTKQEVTTALTV